VVVGYERADQVEELTQGATDTGHGNPSKVRVFSYLAKVR
jgi:hypothetical protein